MELKVQQCPVCRRYRAFVGPGCIECLAHFGRRYVEGYAKFVHEFESPHTSRSRLGQPLAAFVLLVLGAALIAFVSRPLFAHHRAVIEAMPVETTRGHR